MDKPHPDIVKALRQAGIAVVSTAGVGNDFPDLVAAFRDVNVLLEVKTPGKKPTKGQQDFHATWPGPIAVVHDPEEAITAVVRFAREAGRI